MSGGKGRGFPSGHLSWQPGLISSSWREVGKIIQSPLGDNVRMRNKLGKQNEQTENHLANWHEALSQYELNLRRKIGNIHLADNMVCEEHRSQGGSGCLPQWLCMCGQAHQDPAGGWSRELSKFEDLKLGVKNDLCREVHVFWMDAELTVLIYQPQEGRWAPSRRGRKDPRPWLGNSGD